MPRLSFTSGIAIGPILFIIAILGILAAYMSSSGGGFGTAGTSDRVSTEIVSQANLIRSKIFECNTIYGTNSNGDGWPESDQDDGTLVTALDCIGDPAGKKNIWTGIRPSSLAIPTQGFGPWYYMNKIDDVRCIWTQPISASIGPGVMAGLEAAKTKFSSQEVLFNNTGTSHRFVIFITSPVDPDNTDEHCKSE